MSEETTENTSSTENYKLPQGVTLQHCAKLSIVEDKPIMFDYWTDNWSTFDIRNQFKYHHADNCCVNNFCSFS